MRPLRLYAAAAGPSAWVPIDTQQSPFGIGFRCTVQQSASLTYTVQHGFSDLTPVAPVFMTRVTTTATMTWPVSAANPTHGLSTGDSIINDGYGAPFDGTFTVTVTSTTTATFTVANSGLTASSAGNTERIFVGNHPVVASQTASADGNYAYPPNYIRINVTVFSSGAVTMSINQGE